MVSAHLPARQTWRFAVINLKMIDIIRRSHKAEGTGRRRGGSA
jgi:hypothetical protein